LTNIQIVEKSDQVILANNFVALAVDKARGQYTLVSVCDKIPARLEARTDIMYQTAAGGSRQAWPGQVTHWQHAPHQDVHGTGIEARFDLAPLTRHLSTQLQVRLYADQPFIALRLVAHNQCTQPVSLKSFSPLHAVPRDKGLVRIGLEARPLTWLKNGYQAWSFAGALQAHQLDIGTRLGPITRLQVFNGLTPQSRRRGVFWSEMFALLGNVPCGVGILAGQLTTADQFTAIGADCRADQSALQTICQADDVTLSPDAQMASEWIYLEFADLRSDDPLAAYTAAVGRQMKARIPSSVKSGWCSWYYFFTQVQEQDFLANLDTIARAHAELPFQVVQLDDGYQSDVGDWLSINVKFPHGLAWLAEQVKAHGLAPGLWIAPFIVKPTAQLESDHPEWLLKDRRGRPVSSGYNWWQWTHALDVSQPGAQEYVRQVIDTAVHEWGFPYLKLDFLYAAAMPGQRLDPSLTRAQALRQGLELIRQAAHLAPASGYSTPIVSARM
jgi:alpha-galactosidase